MSGVPMNGRPNEIAPQQPALSSTTKALWLAAMQHRRRADALAKSGEAQRSL